MFAVTRRAGAVSLIALSAALAAPASAQTAPQGQGVFTMLGRIVLGAGRARVAIETPQAVTALEAEDIEREQASTPGEVLRMVPGVQAFGSEGMTGQFLNIRGVGGTTASEENRIVVVVDGVQKYFEAYRLGSQFGEPDLYRRVEVLRGPGSALLQSAGAIGGVVSFETREASDFLAEGSDTALRVRAGANTNGAGYNGSLILAHRFNERFEMLGALVHRNEADYDSGDGTNVAGTNMSAASALVSGTWRLSDNGGSRLRFSLQRWRTQGIGVPFSAYGNFDSVFGNVDRTVTDDTAQITWESGDASPWWDARVQLSWTDTTVVQENATSPALGSLGWDTTYGYTTLALTGRNTITARGANWENYLTIGFRWADRERVQYAIGPGGPVTFAHHPAGTGQEMGFYLQNEFILNERLTVLAALRHDRSSVTATAGLPPAQAHLLGREVSHSGTAASLALRYEITPSFSVFGTLAETARLPTLDEVFDAGQAGNRLVSLNLRPERARTYELGFAWQGHDVLTGGDSLDVKVTAFDNRFRDRIESNPDLAGERYHNIGLARIRGIELEAGYQSQTFFGRLALSSIDGVNQTPGAAFGTRLASTPAPEAVLELGYHFLDGELDAGWRGTFAGSASLAPTAGFPAGERFPGYVLHDLFLTWRPSQGMLRGAVVQVSANNIFDVQYHNILDGTRPFAHPRRGRDFRVSIGRQFNF